MRCLERLQVKLSKYIVVCKIRVQVGAKKRKNQYRLRREAVLLHRLIGTIKPIKSGTKGIILWESLCCSLQKCDKYLIMTVLCLFLHLSVANGFVSSKIYDKRDDFDFDIVNFPFLDGDVPRRASYGVYISQLIRFARVCNNVTDFNARNKCLTTKLLQQGYRYHKLRKTFSKFYRRHYELISKYNVGLKTLLSEGLSEPEFYGDLVYKFKKLKGINDFSFQFRKIITRYRRIGYNLNVMRQSACLVFNPIMVDNYAAFFNCTPVGRASDSMMAPT